MAEICDVRCRRHKRASNSVAGISRKTLH